MNTAELLDRIGRPRILVLGDVILDRYLWGSAQRMSPEAPVPVLLAERSDLRLGGAAGVARLLRGLDAEVELAGVLGDDRAGQAVRRLLGENGIGHESVLFDPERPTTLKERFIGRASGRHPHHMLRIDRESIEPICEELEDWLAHGVASRLENCQALLVSDYGKGVCTPWLLDRVIRRARRAGLPVLVDPARIESYARYTGATLVMPNRSEAERATGTSISSPADACAAARELLDEHRFAAVLVTLDSEGMVLVGPDDEGRHFPTRPRNVYDVTGAGDMVLAVVGLCLAAGVSLEEAVELANAAAGLEVERLGGEPVCREEILAEEKSRRPPRNTTGKRVTLDRMAELADAYRQEGRRIVFTNGCFDLLHRGHLACLEEAARCGDVLIVAVNGDASVRRLKGPDRPVIPEEDRAALLAGLACVDHVLVFHEDTPHALLRRLRPDVLVKGGTTDEIVGREVIEGSAGQIQRTGRVNGVSTSGILAEVRGGDHRRSA